MAKYGRFGADGSEYVVTRFDTPRPWLNLIGNDVHGLFISQNGFGYSFYRDWESVRLDYVDVVGYVPTHPQTGKFVYLRDLDSGRCWPNVPMRSARGYSGYRCAHGQGYTRITARREGIQTDFLAFVPRGQDPVEVREVTLTNRSRRPRRIKVFPYQQWHLTAPTGITDTLTYTRAAYRPDLNAIVARMTNPTSPLQYDAFMLADYEPQEHACKYDRFVGVYGRLEAPAAVAVGAATNSPASGERMCGVQPWYDCLRIDPCIPSHWKRCEVVRPFRGATYRVRVTNPHGVQTGVARVRVDGRDFTSARIPIFGDGRAHTIDVVMGTTPAAARPD